MKLAFLFLIRTSLNHPFLWERFFETSGLSYSIYIHYVTNTDIGWFNKFKVSKIIPTKWGHISLVEAMNLLLEEAVKDKDNDMFIFLSESCIPVKPLTHIKDNLDINYSYFKVFSPQFPRYNPALKY